ncbi:MAG: MBL fold metallo-hydrolase [Oscillospiraceae bacterium]|nr:MBL fold metallo-hydrolase [Oscillospiraceae bacterium]
MNITVLPLGSLQANCYVAANGSRCAVIDPGAQGVQLAGWLKDNHLTPEAILLTHGHFDHVGGVRALVEEFGMDVYLHEADTTMSGELAQGLYWNKTYGEGDTITVADLTFTVHHTPGHTPGSVCLQMEENLFAGDTLFAGSCGRTDFPGGSWEQMMASLCRLAAMESSYTVFPGHGGQTTIGREKESNPYMKEALGK